MMACLSNKIELVAFLISRSANINVVSKDNGTALQCTSNEDIFSLLIENGADTSSVNDKDTINTIQHRCTSKYTFFYLTADTIAVFIIYSFYIYFIF